MLLYSALLLFSVLIPFILSFDRKVSFYRTWKYLMPSLLIIGSIYIFFDVIFAKRGIWGFNPAYHLNIKLLDLPLEEWLFFILIPYACIFIHYVFISYYPHAKLSDKTVKIFSAAIMIFILIIVAFNFEKAYTVVNFSLLILALLLAMIDKSKVINSYFISFLIMLIPFFIVNSILTGTFIKNEVVWYNNSETLGIRLLTVPVEDIGYLFTLILLNLLLMSRFKKLFNSR